MTRRTPALQQGLLLGRRERTAAPPDQQSPQPVRLRLTILLLLSRCAYQPAAPQRPFRLRSSAPLVDASMSATAVLCVPRRTAAVWACENVISIFVDPVPTVSKRLAAHVSRNRFPPHTRRRSRVLRVVTGLHRWEMASAAEASDRPPCLAHAVLPDGTCTAWAACATGALDPSDPRGAAGAIHSESRPRWPHAVHSQVRNSA